LRFSHVLIRSFRVSCDDVMRRCRWLRALPLSLGLRIS
jgi:hypothetical protein